MPPRPLVAAVTAVLVLAVVPTGAAAHPPVAQSGFTDADGDGLSTLVEVWSGTNPLDPDTDGDGLTDDVELNDPALSPTNADTDGDGLGDAMEQRLGTQPDHPDTDRDRLRDGRERRLGTDPLDPDTDGDGLTDGREVRIHGTDPTKADTDGDGLSDAREVRQLRSSPTNPDTDGDGVRDGEEVDDGDDPAVDEDQPDPFPDDADNDRLTDERERELGTDPTDPDTDGDGLADGDEVDPPGVLEATDPLDPDTDDDGLPDGFERTHDLDPTERTENRGQDLDGDGLGSVLEHRIGTEVGDKDTDDDGIPDGAEVWNRETYPGASPIRTDVYIEVDRMHGVSVNRTKFARAEAAYADAPVENRGQDGIGLHYVFLPESKGTVWRSEPATMNDMARWQTATFDRKEYGYRYLVVAGDVEDEFEPGDEWTVGTRRLGIVDTRASDQYVMRETGHILGLDGSIHRAVYAERLTAEAYPSVMNENFVDATDRLEYDEGRLVDEWWWLEHRANQSIEATRTEA